VAEQVSDGVQVEALRQLLRGGVGQDPVQGLAQRVVTVQRHARTLAPATDWYSRPSIRKS
jgi:hypothetical protein